MKNLFRVSTKAAIFNKDNSKVLIIHMDKINDYGLPGGHIDNNESIEAALKRELSEECGITNIALKQAGFFMHSDGKIILAFVGQLQETEAIASRQNNHEGVPKWLTKEDFKKVGIEPGYRRLVLKNW